MKKNFFLVFLLFYCSTILLAQQDSLNIEIDSISLYDMSIEELSQLKSRYKKTEMEKLVTQAIVAASRKPLSLKRSPSIVSIITADDIEKSGARDMMDVLRLVPGIDFNVDVQGVVGISLRGLWANEGKVLVLLDGQEMNEIAYCGIQLGNNYNISQIKKIEVIRGPGSAIYGGFAEYAVINIMTKSAEEINGIDYHIILGQAINTYSRQNMGITFGKKMGDVHLSISTFAGRGQRSNSIYTDIYGTSFDMKKNANLNPTNVNVGIGYKNLSLRLMYDMLARTTRDGYLEAFSKAYSTNFTQYFAEMKYDQQLSPNLLLQGKFNYKRALPWECMQVPDSIDYYPMYKIIADRYRGNIVAIWDTKYWLNITAGIEGYYDNAQKPEINGTIQLFRNDSVTSVNYTNYAAYIQSLIKSRFANITVGARFDANSASGSAFNPRLGITKRMGKLNVKLLYASSYRAPGIENIQTSINGKILPETSRTFELETGFQFNRNMFLTFSLYDISTRNTIRYVVDTTIVTNEAPEGYLNTNKTIGSQGIDLEYKYKSPIGNITLTYAYYTVANKNVDEANAVSIDRKALLGIANHKLTAVASMNLNRYFYVTPSMVFLGKRYGYTALDSLDNPILTTYKPQLQMNIYFGCNNLVKGLNFGMGVYNISNREILYIQPYNSLHGAYPGMGTEIIFKLSYNLALQSKERIPEN